MRRRPLLIALGIITPLLLVWWALAVASWRPVALGRVAQPDSGTGLFASDDCVLATEWSSSGYLLDLNTGRFQQKHLSGEGKMGLSGNRFWRLCKDKFQRNWIIEIAGQSNSLIFSTKDQHITSFTFCISPEHNRAVALLNNQYLYTWNLQTAQPGRQGAGQFPGVIFLRLMLKCSAL